MRYGALRTAALRLAVDADLVHIQTPFAAHYAGVRAARRRGIPAIATYHTLFEEYLHHYTPFLPARGLRATARALSRSQCNALDAVVVPSLAMRDRLTAYGVVRPMHVIPTGIGLAPYGTGRRHLFRAAHGIPDDRPVALFVGRVAHEKNIDFLLDAMDRVRRRVPSALLLVTGDGPALPHLKRRATELGLTEHVHFLGYLDRARTLPDCYAAADVFAFASKTETQGLVLLEAMASGCPVVALSEMGTRDILEPRRGCRIAPDDPDRFAHTLAELLEDRWLRVRLGAEARVYAAEWSDDAMAARLAACYRGVLGSPATAGALTA